MKIEVDQATFDRFNGDVEIARADFRLVIERDPRWKSQTCGTCEFFRRAVGEEITGYAGTCRESSIGSDGFPRTTDSEPACGRWQEV